MIRSGNEVVSACMHNSTKGAVSSPRRVVGRLDAHSTAVWTIRWPRLTRVADDARIVADIRYHLFTSTVATTEWLHLEVSARTVRRRLQTHGLLVVSVDGDGELEDVEQRQDEVVVERCRYLAHVPPGIRHHLSRQP
ncbi:hypothetical protein Hamer_G005550 [Homarus americanus]|uniref:Uncharacterized protein n=1 Tax=Homarus americanus TaxID=6706 RepID=A0A8J5MX07_HOMAM|nr:hypothetical protein Hamer_G005550 [Homarus americanus]